MALIQAIVSLITQTVGRILSALLDWAVVSLFGRVTGRRKLFLWGMMAAAAAWPVLLFGIVTPKAALYFFAFVPLSSTVPLGLVREIWLAVAVLVPVAVGVTVGVQSPSGRREGITKGILRGFPITAGLAVAFLILLVTVPALRVASMLRGHRDTYVPLVTTLESYPVAAKVVLERHLPGVVICISTDIISEFREFEQNGNLPNLIVMLLPDDHTNCTSPGYPTPRAMVADNDLALGRLVEAISSSVYWRDSAIFVLEDDAQSGPDHVDSHRSILLAASPFVKRGVVDHTFYTTSGVLRTIELILGLPPMSQYDAAATSMYNAFTGTPNLAGYRHVDPIVSLTERNLPSSYGSPQSLAMDFSLEDRAPEALLNEILWRSIRGAHAPVPPPRRSLFVTPASRSARASIQRARASSARRTSPVWVTTSRIWTTRVAS